VTPERSCLRASRGATARHGFAAGFTYMGLLIFIALIGIGLAFTGQLWHAAAQREKEAELLFIGDEFRTAIVAYYETPPDGIKKYPTSLDQLVEDKRHLVPRRHLRRIYRDPMSGMADWGLVRAPDGSITGVYSHSEEAPRKVAGFRDPYEQFSGANKYSEWTFGHVVALAGKHEASAAVPSPNNPVPISPGTGTPPPATPISPPEPDKCELLQARDAATCQQETRRWGEGTGSVCRAAAEDRLSVCRKGGLRLPRLPIRYS
jgi:type II secretory pathway pseudopilin PulG